MANDAPFDDMYQWYENLYPAEEQSNTYSRYCQKVFGRDLSQQGFCTMEQLDDMLDRLGLKPGQKILDIGCGTGKITEYIADVTGTNALGLDYSPTALGLARSRTTDRSETLAFLQANLEDVSFPAESFDAVFAIDSLYFTEDLDPIVHKAYSWLRLGGALAFCYGAIRLDKNEPLEILLPDRTPLAEAFQSAGLHYTAHDLTQQYYEHERLKRKVALELEKDFHDEGNGFLFDYLFRESIDETMRFEEFRESFSRYLYLCPKV